jgi:predicted nucleotidyltransferase
MENIQNILREIEERHNIRILYACETGSRAWGFPSPDSDYDIRFIYRHEKNWYLKLTTPKDTIEFMDGDLDITGWDLRKALLLLKKSNAALIERFQSPVQYYADEDFRTEFIALIHNYYSPTAVFYHHFSLAAKFREEMENSTGVKLKSYFYLVRSLLSCNWIIKNHTVLPMHIEGLMEYIDAESRKELRKLIELKAGVGEKYVHPKDQGMQEIIDHLFDFVDSGKNGLNVNDQDYSLLNNFFLKMINGKNIT